MQNDREVIIIEDSPSDAELTIEALRGKKIAKNILWLKDGEEALNYLKNGSLVASNPQLILLDLKLPKIDGIKVLQRIKEHQKARLVPIVVLTSSNHQVDKISSFESGANSYVVKPVEYKEYMTTIEEVGLYWLLRNAPID